MPVWLVARSFLKLRRRSLVALILVLAGLGGIGLGALAGARRTQSAYPRFERWDRTSTIAIITGEDNVILRRAEHLPQVVSHRRYQAFDIVPLVHGEPSRSQDFEALASVDGRYFDQDIFFATEGRLPERDAVGEVAVNRAAAEAYHYRVGQELTLGIYDDDEVGRASGNDRLEPKIRQTVRITGVGLFPEEVVQDETDRSPLVLFTPAFVRSARRWGTYSWEGMVLRHGDDDVDAFKAGYRKLLPDGFPEVYRVTAGVTFHAQQAIRPLSIALALFGAVAVGSALVLTVLGMTREIGAFGADRQALRSLGFDRRQVLLTSMAGPIIVAVVGLAGAVVVAVAISPSMPRGPVRAVEPDRGISFDGTVLALLPLALLGILSLSMVVLALGGIAAHRRGGARTERASRLADMIGRSGLGVGATLGLLLAFESPRSRAGAASRSVIAAIAIAVACLVAAITFASSLAGLVHTPARYGWDWDAAAIDESGYSNMPIGAVTNALDGQRDIAAWSGWNFGTGLIDGVSTAMLGAQPHHSDVVPPITGGRAPRGPQEIALGATTAEKLHRSVGDEVSIRTDRGTERRRVVGIAVLPTVGVVHGDHTSLGTGAWVPTDDIAGVRRDTKGAFPGPNVVFVRFRDDVDQAAATARFEKLVPKLDPVSHATTYLPVQRPGEIVNTSDLGSSPALLAALLISGSVISLAVMLIGAVRRQRRDLAVVRALGGTSGQLTATVMWQSAATVLVGTIVGVPVGVIAGRAAWRRFAGQLQVVPHPTTPTLAVVALVVGAVLIANLVAIGPGLAAARTPAANALRAE